MRKLGLFTSGVFMAAGLLVAVGASAQSTGSTGGTTQDSNPSVYGSDHGQSGSRGSDDSLSGSSSGSLGGTNQDQGSFGSEQQAGKEIQGTVSKVGQDQLQIKTDQGEKFTLKTDEQTQFQDQKGNVQSLQDIQEGQQVRASYDVSDPNRTALQVEVLNKGTGSTGGAGSSGSTGGSHDSSGSMGGSHDSSGSMGGSHDSSGSQGGSDSESDY